MIVCHLAWAALALGCAALPCPRPPGGARGPEPYPTWAVHSLHRSTLLSRIVTNRSSPFPNLLHRILFNHMPSGSQARWTEGHFPGGRGSTSFIRWTTPVFLCTWRRPQTRSHFAPAIPTYPRREEICRPTRPPPGRGDPEFSTLVVSESIISLIFL